MALVLPLSSRMVLSRNCCPLTRRAESVVQVLTQTLQDFVVVADGRAPSSTGGKVALQLKGKTKIPPD